jgi:aspartyl/asparaginyl beta-hydroxylase (cupin superfamily)
MAQDTPYFSSRTEDTALLWKRLQKLQPGSAPQRIQQCLRVRFGQEQADYANSLQRPEFYIPGLRSLAWHDPAEFPWVGRLESAHAAIAAECQALAGSGALDRRPEGRGGRWATAHLYFLGERSAELCERCPVTSQLIESIPGADHAGLVYFASLAPGTHLEPHCGPTNARLRCHLGLKVPDGCSIRVGAETRLWTEGKCFVFDDSFEHEVWHLGTEVRTVLVFDIWHPDLTVEEIAAIAELTRLSAANAEVRAKLH